MKFNSINRFAGLALVAALASPSAHSGILTLTPAGVNLGFTLTTFATLNPGLENNFGFGPFGIAMDTTGGVDTVVVHNFFNSTRYTFADVDGQTRASALTSVPSGSGAIGYATAGGVAYGGDSASRAFVQFRKDGTVHHVLTGVPFQGFLGMAGNPVNGHIVASTASGQLIDIDPLANGGLGSATVIASVGSMDGVSVSPDGTRAVVEFSGTIRVYEIATGALLATYAHPLLTGVDGTGVISSRNSLNGDIVAVTNFGSVVLIDPNGFNDIGPAEFLTIARGGSRGDYTAPDVSNGTLFIDMSEAVYRLSCGTGCVIGAVESVGESVGESVAPGPNAVSEPTSLALFGLASLGLLRSRYRVV